MNSDMLEANRSSRSRKVVSNNEDAGIELPSLRKRAKTSSSTSYTGRASHEIKVATAEKRNNAMERAEKLRNNLQSGRPSFIKSMIRSHVYTCFWLGLPSQFCKEHLPLKAQMMVLENEKGEEFEANFIGERGGLSGGWRGFALKHKLDDGDAVVFELTKPTRFKVYIVRAHVDMKEDNGAMVIPAKEEHKMEKHDDEKVEIEKSLEHDSVKVKNELNTTQKKPLKQKTRVPKGPKKATKPVKSEEDVVASNYQELNIEHDPVKVDEEDDIDDVILNGAIETSKKGGNAVVSSKIQREDAPKLFRKRSFATTKLFRKKSAWA